mgnify:CR=1 FL=1
MPGLSASVTMALILPFTYTLDPMPAIVLLAVGLFRILVLCFQGEVWAAWLTLGGIFIAGGALCWKQRIA